MTPIPDTTGHLPVPSIDDLSVLEVLALTLAHETGQLVHEGRPADLANTTGTKTSDTDPVTVMDTRAEEHLRRRLRAARPDDGL
ncbi:MAG TPA: inositol monophosphatase family protein, partial [Dermatophilaceae bacterium]|nr:inositol monophosphatase family protein [Dermatophilaceae bacterium]